MCEPPVSGEKNSLRNFFRIRLKGLISFSFGSAGDPMQPCLISYRLQIFLGLEYSSVVEYIHAGVRP
jgi:hypothetical protein